MHTAWVCAGGEMCAFELLLKSLSCAHLAQLCIFLRSLLVKLACGASAHTQGQKERGGWVYCGWYWLGLRAPDGAGLREQMIQQTRQQRNSYESFAVQRGSKWSLGLEFPTIIGAWAATAFHGRNSAGFLEEQRLTFSTGLAKEVGATDEGLRSCSVFCVCGCT